MVVNTADVQWRAGMNARLVMSRPSNFIHLTRIRAGLSSRLFESCEGLKDALLLVVFDDLRRAHLRVVRVESNVAKSTPLSQKVPALIQFDLDLREPLPIRLRKRPFLVQSVFLRNTLLNIVEDGLILGMILHRSLLLSERDGVV